jgi:hypothetical protein
MAARYAGDIFNISLDGEEESDSRLVELFPGLASPKFQEDKDSYYGFSSPREPRLVGGYKAAPVFGGFKTFGMQKKEA